MALQDCYLFKCIGFKNGRQIIIRWSSYSIAIPQSLTGPRIVRTEFRLMLMLSVSIGNIYTIGGNHDPTFRQTLGQVVSKLNLQNGCMGRIQQLPQSTSLAAIATAYDMLGVCGGINKGSPTSRCQVLALCNEMYVSKCKPYI